jgi:hypothetical protein
LSISEKKLAFFSKTNDQIFAKTSSSLRKNANIFAKIFGKKYFLNHNIGPCFGSFQFLTERSQEWLAHRNSLTALKFF